MKRSALVYLAGFVSCGFLRVLVAAAHSPKKALPDRDVSYPAAEDLATDTRSVIDFSEPVFEE